MKYLKEFEGFIEYNNKYIFEIGDLVKLKYEHQDRVFKVIDRKRIANKKINTYYLETIDEYSELLEIHLWEYQSKILKLSSKEIEIFNIKMTAKKYNL